MVTDRSKVLRQVDYAPNSGSLLRFERLYLSVRALSGESVASGWGSRWKSNYDRSISVNTKVSPPIALHIDENESMAAFKKQGSAWIASGGSVGILKELLDLNGLRTGWRYISGVAAEEFDASGRLVAVVHADGKFLGLTYWPSGDVASITDNFGRALNFSVATDSVDGRKYAGTMVDPSGHPTRYFFDDASDGGPSSDGIKAFDLTKVVFPDGQSKRYQYSELNQFVSSSGSTMPPAFSLLTGVMDETGQRYSSYTYDSGARVVTSELVGGVNRYTFASGVSQDNVVVTDPLGTVRTYWMLWQRVSHVDQPAGAGSGPCAQSNAFDLSSGLVTERSDFNGVKTCYAYDVARKLVTKRVEGLNSSASCSAALTSPPVADTTRVITTDWHPDWRLEVRRAEPKRITTWVYNGYGAVCAPADALVDGKPIAVVCSKTEQATTDETGALGFTGAASGSARTWTYTYNRWGQMLASNGPRSDVVDTTTYEYYPDTQPNWTMGDLKQTTNAAGHVTRFTQYNRHGQVLQRIDPNGLVTQYTYDLRQRLTSITTGDEQTRYDYDPVGNLKKITLPDGGFIAYTYDAAHRLIQVDDHKGNKVVYTLDAMGNRINEKATDPSGALVRNLSRAMDALNRVQQVVGE